MRGKEKRKREMEKGKTKREGEGKEAVAIFFYFLLEREHLLSKIPVNPTVRFLRTKKQSGLHIEDYMWALVLGVFDKLREVGVLSYLFYPLFKCFVKACVGLRP